MSNKKFDVIVVGELNVDLILNRIESFPEMGKEKIADEMKKHEVIVFVAHDDIEVGTQDWEIVLKDNIVQCDTFVVLLTDNFHKASYTDHEVGIAYALKKTNISNKI